MFNDQSDSLKAVLSTVLTPGVSVTIIRQNNNKISWHILSADKAAQISSKLKLTKASDVFLGFFDTISKAMVDPVQLLMATFTVDEETSDLQLALNFVEKAHSSDDTPKAVMLLVTNFDRIFSKIWIENKTVNIADLTAAQMISHVKNPWQMFNAESSEAWKSSLHNIGTTISIKIADDQQNITSLDVVELTNLAIAA